MSAPTLVDYQESTWNDATTPKDSASISWLAGDVIVVIAGTASANIPAVPTATGLTFTSQKSSATAGHCGVRCSAAVAASSGSSVVSGSVAGADLWGFGVWVWRTSRGIGNSAIADAETVSLTPLGINGAIMWGSFDFNATATATFTPTQTNIREQTDHGTTYTTQVADLIDQTGAGAVSYGTTGGIGVYTVVAVEVQQTPVADQAGRMAVQQRMG